MSEAPARLGGSDALDVILHSYSAVFLARSRPAGALLLLATLTTPHVGLMGLLGVILAALVHLALGLDRHALRSGAPGANGLLLFLGLGALTPLDMPVLVLAPVLAVVVVLLHSALSRVLARLHLPALSLAFVFTLWLALLVLPMRPPPPPLFGPSPGALLTTLGSLTFGHWPAGVLTVAAIALWSRVALLHGIVGFATMWIFVPLAPELPAWAGFNAIIVAIGLGGVFRVPSPASLALAAAGALLAGLLSFALPALLGPLGLHPLALPLNLALLVSLLVPGRATVTLAGRPEDHVVRARTSQGLMGARHQLPVRGPWIITQGNDGEYTHRGPLRHGLDFEVANADGQRFTGTGRLASDYLAHGLPVVAPCAGTVQTAVDGLPDNTPGDADLEHPWGNHIVLHVGPQRWMVLAHLEAGTLGVRPGQTVTAGEVLARCGASGNAPTPHVHAQLQAHPAVGSPTLPLGFGPYIVEGEVPQVILNGTPSEGQTVRRLEPARRLPKWGRLVSGDTLQLVGSDPSKTLTLTALTTSSGGLVLRTPAGDSLTWGMHQGVVHTGPPSGRGLGLRMVHLALPWVPMDISVPRPGTTLTWTAFLHPMVLTPRLGDALREAVSPRAPLPVCFTATCAEETWHITGRATDHTTQAVLDGEGIALLELVQGGRPHRFVRGAP